ncbi:hypothetical protein T4D_12341 [Trichinella pseudospiralis]|uniref:Uncharacterized protein n=1 Tax=Trichinella pseudospiralis TaxID=6337 RepID=A0A0V1FGJ7_TRIPS|nr:hypothetical protein T4D_12341 [Trichinella pseudospiralis]
MPCNIVKEKKYFQTLHVNSLNLSLDEMNNFQDKFFAKIKFINFRADENNYSNEQVHLNLERKNCFHVLLKKCNYQGQQGKAILETILNDN